MDAEQLRDQLTGPIPSIRTPFLKDGAIDFDSLRKMIDFVIDAGARSIMLTAGDSHLFALSDDELAEVTRITCEHAATRVTVIAADRFHSTARAVSFATLCRDAGAHVMMTLPPHWGNGVTSDTLASHYAAVADVMPVMIVTNLFNQLGEAVCFDAVETALDLSPNVVAIKEDMGGTSAQKLALRVHNRCSILAGGQKINHMNLLPFGVDGYLSSFMTFRPKVAHAYWQAIEQNDMAAAQTIVNDFDIPLFEVLMKLPGGFDAGLHAILELVNQATRFRRLPYYSLSDDELDQFAHQLAVRGIL